MTYSIVFNHLGKIEIKKNVKLNSSIEVGSLIKLRYKKPSPIWEVLDINEEGIVGRLKSKGSYGHGPKIGTVKLLTSTYNYEVI